MNKHETEGLPRRIYLALLRADFGTVDAGHCHRDGPLDRDRIQKAINDGAILDKRLIGKKSVESIRLWLATP